MRSARALAASFLLLMVTGLPAQAATQPTAAAVPKAAAVPGAAATVRADDLPGTGWRGSAAPTAKDDPRLSRCYGTTALDRGAKYATGVLWTKPVTGGAAAVSSRAAVVGAATASALASRLAARLTTCTATVQLQLIVESGVPVVPARATTTTLKLTPVKGAAMSGVRLVVPLKAPFRGSVSLDTIIVTSRTAQARVVVSSTVPLTVPQLSRLAARVGSRLPR